MSTGFEMDQNIITIIVSVCAIIQIAILLPMYYKRFLGSMKHTPTLKAIAFCIMYYVICGAIYVIGGSFTARKYAQYAFDRDKYQRNDPLGGRLPDRILDVFNVAEDSNLVMVADAVAFVFPLAATISCLILVHTDLLNVMVFQVSVLIVANAIAENVTMLPASIGWKRCKHRSYSDWTSIDDWAFGIGGVGGCASMMWSGHTVHSILPAFCLFSSLEREFGIVARLTKPKFICLPVKGMLTILVGFAEACLILATHDHYSVDIWIAFVITTLVLSNPKIEYWAGRINPFIKHLNMPKTFYEKALLNQKVLTELKTRSPSAFQVLCEDGVPPELAKWSRCSEFLPDPHEYQAAEKVKPIAPPNDFHTAEEPIAPPNEYHAAEEPIAPPNGDDETQHIEVGGALPESQDIRI